MKTALGEHWMKWFVRDCSQDTILPKQVVILVRDSLKRMSDSWDEAVKAGQITVEAAGSYAALSGAAKKRRASLLDVKMAANQ